MSYCFISLQLTNPNREGKKLISPVLSPALSQGPALKDPHGDHKGEFLSLSWSVHMWVKCQEVSTPSSTCPDSRHQPGCRVAFATLLKPTGLNLLFQKPDCPINDYLGPLAISLWRQNTKGGKYKGGNLQNLKTHFVSSAFKAWPPRMR